MSKTPKAGENKAADTETICIRVKLEQELGRLTYEIAKLNEQLRLKVQRSNAIATTLEELNGK